MAVWRRKKALIQRWTCIPSKDAGLYWHDLIGTTVQLTPIGHADVDHLIDEAVRVGQGLTDDPNAPYGAVPQESGQQLSFSFQISQFNSAEPLGWIGLTSSDLVTGSIGYWMGARGRGKGYTKEAASLVTKFALGHIGLSAVVAEAAQSNVASLRVAAAAGLHIVGTSQTVRPNGQQFDCYRLARDDGPFPDKIRCAQLEDIRAALAMVRQSATEQPATEQSAAEQAAAEQATVESQVLLDGE
jgi:Acetyltransferase (GNAT) domain